MSHNQRTNYEKVTMCKHDARHRKGGGWSYANNFMFVGAKKKFWLLKCALPQGVTLFRNVQYEGRE